MFKLFNSRGNNTEFLKFANSIKESFLRVREEFTEHLEAINDNSRENQENYEHICEIENKIEKLNEKIDEISVYLSRSFNYGNGNIKDLDSCVNIDLSSREKEIFLVLYTSDETKPLYYSDLAAKLGISEHLAREYVLSMITKGIPINKVVKNSKVLLSLDSQFKQVQAKHNVLKLNSTLTRWFNSEIMVAN